MAAFRFEYDAFVRIWGDVERKAQAVVSASGIFIGGVVAFATKASDIDLFQASLAIVGVVMLGAALLRASQALKVRDDVPIVPATEVWRFEDDNASDPYLLRLWADAVEEMKKLTEAKADRLGDAQLCLMIAIDVFGGVAVWILVAGMMRHGTP